MAEKVLENAQTTSKKKQSPEVILLDDFAAPNCMQNYEILFWKRELGAYLTRMPHHFRIFTFAVFSRNSIISL